jgi:hypothetical protein
VRTRFSWLKNSVFAFRTKFGQFLDNLKACLSRKIATVCRYLIVTLRSESAQTYLPAAPPASSANVNPLARGWQRNEDFSPSVYKSGSASSDDIFVFENANRADGQWTMPVRANVSRHHIAFFSLILSFSSADQGRSVCFRNVGTHLPVYTVS